MALSLFTAPSLEPLTTAEAKLHLRVDGSTDDALIDTLIAAARQYVEGFTHRPLLRQTWDDKRDGFPCSGEPIWLQLPPVSSVTSITYIDPNGVTQTWSSSLYDTDLPAGPYAQMARISPAYGQYYPQTRDVMNAVVIRFVCGYGTTAATVPEAIRAAIKLLIGHWYGQAEAVLVGAISKEIELGVQALLWPYKAL